MTWGKSGVDINFTNGFYESRSPQQSAQRCVGYFPVIHERPTLSPESLFNQPGIESIISNLSGSARGSTTVNGIPYIVCGTKLYRINQTVNPDLSITWSATDVGDIAGSERVIMSAGKTGSDYELVIVDPGVSTYHYDLATNSLTSLDGLSNFLTPAIDVCNVFGYFVFLQEGTNTLFHSNLRDAQTYSALDFFTVTQAETLKGIINFRDQLFVFSEFKIIPFNHTGRSGFAFDAQFNAVKPYGLRSLHGKSDLGSYLCFLGNRRNAEPGVFVYTGGEPQKISTTPVDKAIQNLTTQEVDNAFILTWSQSGGDFFSVTAGNLCLVYNFRSGRWSENRSYINGVDFRWRVNSIVQAFNVIIVGDSDGGSVGILNDDLSQEYGSPILRYVTIQPYDAKGKFFNIKSIIVIADHPGEFTLEVSRDGITWPDPAIERTTEAGEYGKVYRWDRLGEIPFLGTMRISTASTSKSNINKVVALI